MGDDAATKKGIHAMTGAVEELIGYHELEWLVLFLERSDGRNGDDTLDAELFESMDVGAKIEFAWHDAVAASVPREERDLASFEDAADIGVRGSAERRF